MPTIHRQGPFQITFYSKEEGEPPHLHIWAGGNEAKVWLTPVALAKSDGFKAREITAILRIVRERQHDFLDEWHGYFGTSRS